MLFKELKMNEKQIAPEIYSIRCSKCRRMNLGGIKSFTENYVDELIIVLNFVFFLEKKKVLYMCFQLMLSK